MGWTVLVMIAGICICAAAFAFGFIYVLPRARIAQRGSAEEERCNGLRELCLAVVFGGVVLILIGTITNDVRFAPAPVNPAMFLGPGAFFVWLFGFWVGRLSLRRQRDIAR